jgi:hypothetical protein
MFCRQCGKEIADKAVICIQCGVPVKKGTNYCQSCRQTTFASDTYCNKCGVKLLVEGKDWLTTLLLNIFLGAFGAHRFYTGNIGIAVGQLLTLGGCGIWAIIDLILILTGEYYDGEGNRLDRKNY